MEVFLHLWDEIDDLVSVCRHVASAAASEVVDGALPLVVGASTLAVWVLDGLYRQLLRLSA